MPWMTVPVAIALGGATAAQAATTIYGQKKAGDQNKQAMAASDRSEQRAIEEAALDREEQRQERLHRQRMQEQQWNDYIRINEPTWRAGSNVLGSLYQMAGLGQAPAYSTPRMPSAAPMTTTPASAAPRSRFVPQPPRLQQIPQAPAFSLFDMMAMASMVGESTEVPRK